MPVLQIPAEGPSWLPGFARSIGAAFKQKMAAPFWLWSAATVDLPTTTNLGANEGAIAYDETTNRPVYYDGANWKQVAPLGSDTTYLWRANNLSDVADVATSRTNLGLGTAAVKNTGTTGNTVPLLDGINTWSAVQTFSVSPTFTLGIVSTTTFSTIIFRGESGGAAVTSGLRIEDTDASHTLKLTVGSDLTANRKLTLTTGNANRTLDISAGDVTITVAGAALIDDADAAAQRTTLGLVAGGAGDIWVEKAGDTMTEALLITKAWGTGMPGLEVIDTASPGSTSGASVRMRGAKPTGADQRIAMAFFGALDSSATIQNSAAIQAFAQEDWGTLGGEGTYLTFEATASGAFSRTVVARVTSAGIEPAADNTFYLGRNDDDTPRAWKGLILKDQTTGTYYRLQINSGAVNLIDLTD